MLGVTGKVALESSRLGFKSCPCHLSSHVQMCVLNHKEGRVPKNWCFWTVLLKMLECSLYCKEIQPVHPKGNQSWIFIGRTGAETEAPILQPPDAKSQLIGKDPNAGKEWGWKEKEAAEDETVREHCWLNGHESEQTPGATGGQWSLACFSLKDSDVTLRLNNCTVSTALASQYVGSGEC